MWVPLIFSDLKHKRSRRGSSECLIFLLDEVANLGKMSAISSKWGNKKKHWNVPLKASLTLSELLR